MPRRRRRERREARDARPRRPAAPRRRDLAHTPSARRSTRVARVGPRDESPSSPPATRREKYIWRARVDDRKPNRSMPKATGAAAVAARSPHSRVAATVSRDAAVQPSIARGRRLARAVAVDYRIIHARRRRVSAGRAVAIPTWCEARATARPGAATPSTAAAARGHGHAATARRPVLGSGAARARCAGAGFRRRERRGARRGLASPPSRALPSALVAPKRSAPSSMRWGRINQWEPGRTSTPTIRNLSISYYGESLGSAWGARARRAARRRGPAARKAWSRSNPAPPAPRAWPAGPRRHRFHGDARAHGRARGPWFVPPARARRARAFARHARFGRRGLRAHQRARRPGRDEARARGRARDEGGKLVATRPRSARRPPRARRRSATAGRVVINRTRARRARAAPRAITGRVRRPRERRPRFSRGGLLPVHGFPDFRGFRAREQAQLRRVLELAVLAPAAREQAQLARVLHHRAQLRPLLLPRRARGPLEPLALRHALVRAVLPRHERQQVRHAEDPLDPPRGLHADRDPVLDALEVEADLLHAVLVRERVPRPDALEVVAVALAPRVRHDDAKERVAAVAEALQAHAQLVVAIERAGVARARRREWPQRAPRQGRDHHHLAHTQA